MLLLAAKPCGRTGWFLGEEEIDGWRNAVCSPGLGGFERNRDVSSADLVSLPWGFVML